ncbi:MAG: ABC transporter ATP-binding protein, partial [Armatimonadota bacterium]
MIELTVESMNYPGLLTSGNLIEDYALTVQAGSIVSLVGRSGIGKTTILRLLAGLERRFQGTVLVNGQPVTAPSRRIQMVFQDYRLLPWKTVQGNVRFALQNGRHLEGDDSSVRQWLEIVGLWERRDSWPKTLSGGECARVAFARAFVDKPAVLLLDEPFRGLDVCSRLDLHREFLKSLAVEPAAVVLVSHSIEDAVLLSDVIHVLSGPPLRTSATFRLGSSRPRDPGSEECLRMAAQVTNALLTNQYG